VQTIVETDARAVLPVTVSQAFRFNESVFAFSTKGAMVLEGFAGYEPTGYYGLKTEIRVKAFRKARGISPASGRCGPLTRTKLNEKYKQLS
jgi:peptidoglycan hydrolase-like protein with peptidoglycan-binding domain